MKALMKKSPTAPPSLSRKLRHLGLRHPGVEEGVACEGTVIEKRTLKLRGRAFLFLGPTDAMLKLADSLPEAQALTKEDPEHFRAGLGGWTKVMFADGRLPLKLMERWIAESYGLFVKSKTAPKPRAKAAKKNGARRK
jgi:hypothetical protein